jgi:CheY-like chemotaxis protein
MSKKLRILVVDDDADNAQSLGELFELEGHLATVVHSGEAAIAAYVEQDFDVVFMDVMMPGKNGVESFSEIRKLKPNAHVYMMTGYSVDELLQQAIDGGAKGVFGKPVNLNKVLSTLSTIEKSGVVLIGEDDPDFGPMLCDVVGNTGYKTQLVTNGRDAVERIIAGGVDMLVLDLKMPLMDGIEVILELRRKGIEVPTIIITAHADAYENLEQALGDVMVTGILNKPFDPLVLLGKLEALAK